MTKKRAATILLFLFLLLLGTMFLIPVFLWYLLFHKELREGLKL